MIEQVRHSGGLVRGDWWAVLSTLQPWSRLWGPGSQPRRQAGPSSCARLGLPGPGWCLQGLAGGGLAGSPMSSGVHAASRDTLGTRWALCRPLHVV